ncbi:MAG TPA: hypothetical protein DCZ95_07955 [Verrucomicrobia bacterium]|nr:MAG: hypothetical protein A2X46_14795 [Lentisphaerae bacterium GWF2_57_35]HBA84010.1 hypothetical protein [Verrucomicrobiota bacterium]
MTRSLSAQWGQIQRKLFGLSDHLSEHHGAGSWSPNTDVCVSGDDVIVKMELAGVAKDSIRIRIEGDALIVEGVRRDPYGGESTAGYKFIQMELEYGPFRRVVGVPFPIDGDRSMAQFDGGILRILLPRARSCGATKITVIMEN